MRRVLTILGIILVVAIVAGGVAYALGYLPLDRGGEETADATDAPDEQIDEPIRANQTIIVDARVVPVQKADLSMSTGGVVEHVFVQEGDEVEEGQVLLQLDSARQRVEVARAQADLARAQAQLDQLLAGPLPEEVKAAEAAYDASLARLQRIVGGAEEGDIAAAQARVDAAQASLQKVLEGASDQELIAAKADLANAEAELQRAQSAYNEVKWRTDLAALPQSADLQRATNNYEAARARYDDLLSGASAADISNAQANVRQSQAQLEALQATTPADIAAAEADVRSAEAQLELVKTGARPEEIEAAQANVAMATAALQGALVSLADTELTAPFAGTVAALNIDQGEQLAAGTPVIQLADLSEYQIETEDLTELQIVDVELGQSVEITFDAIPDLVLPGTVRRIRLLGQDNRGDIVYTVVVEPEEQDSRLLWNMTAVVTFE